MLAQSMRNYVGNLIRANSQEDYYSTKHPSSPFYPYYLLSFQSNDFMDEQHETQRPIYAHSLMLSTHALPAIVNSMGPTTIMFPRDKCSKETKLLVC